MFPLDTRGKDSGEVSQRPALLAGLATLFSPDFHTSLHRSRSRHKKACLPPLLPPAQSRVSKQQQPGYTAHDGRQGLWSLARSLERL